ncbi:MAG: hypothetical protein AAGE13_07835 [Pseudomonadota bacterium]
MPPADMPVDRLVLIAVAAAALIAAVAVFAGLLAGMILAGWVLWPALALFLFAAYVILRIVFERLTNREDDRYENIEH